MVAAAADGEYSPEVYLVDGSDPAEPLLHQGDVVAAHPATGHQTGVEGRVVRRERHQLLELRLAEPELHQSLEERVREG